MKHVCPNCKEKTLPSLRVMFMTSRTHGVECINCHREITRPFWTFVVIALLLPIWVVWIKLADPLFHVGMYGLQVVALWAAVVLVLSPLKTMRHREKNPS